MRLPQVDDVFIGLGEGFDRRTGGRVAYVRGRRTNCRSPDLCEEQE